MKENPYLWQIKLIQQFTTTPYIVSFCESVLDQIEYDTDRYPTDRQIFWISKWKDHYLSKVKNDLQIS